MAERFKAADCKSVEISHRRFKSYSLQKLKYCRCDIGVET